MGIAQLVERQFVALKVVGSNPTIHPPRMKFIKIEKFKIKKKKFKKNKFILLKLIESSTNAVLSIKNVSIFKNLSLYNFMPNCFSYLIR